MNGDVVVTWPAFEADGPTTGALLTQAGLGIRLHPRTDNRTPEELADILGDAVGVIASTDPFDYRQQMNSSAEERMTAVT